MTLELWATAQAERLIAPLGDRWTHVQAVADRARGLASVLSAADADLLVAAALLHDVGYAPSLNRLGFHAVQAVMGHEQASTTLDRYTHVPADTHARVRAALNAPAACSPPAGVRAAGDDR
jgi:HD superfamily phosphodiesterase